MLIFDLEHQPLLAWYQWLEDREFELGRDYHWAVDRPTGRWGIRLGDGRQELIMLLQCKGLIYREDEK